MSFQTKDISILNEANRNKLEKDSWLVILHANRIPPHIGLLINGKYQSLTIKGHELNIDIKALEKTIAIKHIETLFIKLKTHPVFSLSFQMEIAQYYIQQYERVQSNQSTCLSPIKLFLQEFYVLPYLEDELLFDLIERLKSNDYISEILSTQIELENQKEIKLPRYTNTELGNRIAHEHSLIKK